MNSFGLPRTTTEKLEADASEAGELAVGIAGWGFLG
jgi:hypothetical protein